MTLIKYMSWITTLSVFTALISIIYQAFLLLKQLNKVTNILTGMLAIEASYRRSTIEPKAKVALGYGACSDLVISATEFLNFTLANLDKIGPEFTVDEINDEEELIQTFAYYFQNGAAAERNMPNSRLFNELITKAKHQHRDSIKWFIGGNAPLMGIRFHLEGADVLLGARMSHNLRRLVPTHIRIAGEQIPEDDIHIILEYKSGDTWGSLTAPRANRYILHNDQNNPQLNSLEDFALQLKKFKPHLLVISGLQMMDSHKFEPGVREARLSKVEEQISEQPRTTLIHFEMASYVELQLLLQLQQHVLPFVDSLGMNEQELENLRNILQFRRTTLASDWNPRVATTLDHMRYVFKTLANDYYENVSSVKRRRLLTRIHVHTLAYQALMVVRGDGKGGAAAKAAWKQTRVAAAKAALTAHRYVCQTEMINPEAANLILDDSFATSTESQRAARIQLKPTEPVPCWNETLAINTKQQLDIEICVAPVLVCRVARKTAGAGDNISAAALSQQF